mmetsp:Transcript_13173/g.42110  ORF Transcript_13173/g.42110 Transcript_13173/m.42110 type:complete len:217 (+) Transcript_13173:768-1418(+)
MVSVRGRTERLLSSRLLALCCGHGDAQSRHLPLQLLGRAPRCCLAVGRRGNRRFVLCLLCADRRQLLLRGERAPQRRLLCGGGFVGAAAKRLAAQVGGNLVQLLGDSLEGRAALVLLCPPRVDPGGEGWRECRAPVGAVAHRRPLALVERAHDLRVLHRPALTRRPPQGLPHEHLPRDDSKGEDVGSGREDRPAVVLVTEELWRLVPKRATPRRVL